MGLRGYRCPSAAARIASGRVDSWRKVKCWTESTLILIGTELDKRSGAPVAMLARHSDEGLSYAPGPSLPSKPLSGGTRSTGPSDR
jgi:hypothetical protein